MQDVYKRSLQAAKKGKILTFHWRGGYLTREVLNELITQNSNGLFFVYSRKDMEIMKFMSKTMDAA